MKYEENEIKEALQKLEPIQKPTDAQKDRILAAVLASEPETVENDTIWQSVQKYPWRFAFAVSAVQALFFTLLFGTGYTNMLLGYIQG